MYSSKVRYIDHLPCPATREISQTDRSHAAHSQHCLHSDAFSARAVQYVQLSTIESDWNIITIKISAQITAQLTPTTILNSVFAPLLLVQQIVNCVFTLSPHTPASSGACLRGQ